MNGENNVKRTRLRLGSSKASKKDDDKDLQMALRLEGVDFGEQEYRVLDHSTPKRSDRFCDVDESMLLDKSTYMPCTQECNEVAWDWAAVAQANGCIVKTPTRKTQLQNIRNSNSPLIHKAPKRISTGKSRENMQQLTAEMEAIADRLKTQLESKSEVPSGEKSSSEMVADSGVKMEEMFDDLDDVDLDACLARCSQEVEEAVGKSCNNSGKSDVLCEAFPDDSFDDILKTWQELNEKESRQTENLVEQKPAAAVKTYSKISSKQSKATSVVTATTTTTTTATSANQERKFFKTKSLSDSLYNKADTSNRWNRTNSETWGRSSASSDRKGSADVKPAAAGNAGVRGSFQQRCTPKEIEKKRLEALARLEAKKRALTARKPYKR